MMDSRLAPGLQWWYLHRYNGVIIHYKPGFKRLVRRGTKYFWFSEYKSNGPNRGHTLYNSDGISLGIEYVETFYQSVGNGRGYYLVNPFSGLIGIGALEIWDIEDGERDLIYGGPLPSNRWSEYRPDRPFNQNEATLIRQSEKEALRAILPLSGTADKEFKLFYDVTALERRHPFVLLAGPSFFSPECRETRLRFYNLLVNGTLTSMDMPQNWNVLVTHRSLRDLIDCDKQKTRDPNWQTDQGVFLYPMLHIIPEDCYTWTPMDRSTWIPKSRLRDYILDYRYDPDEDVINPCITSPSSDD